MEPALHPRIAIIGAGPAGCTLARLLLRSDLPDTARITIYESETGLSSRDQGGTLDLHDDTGLAALKAAGLYEAFLHVARFDGDALAVYDKHMTCYLSLRSSQDGGWLALGKPEVDRRELRKLLLDALPEGIVKWGQRVRRVDGADLSVHFEDGSVERGFDLVVGADGAYSTVRRLLTSQEPFYSGVGGFNMLVPDAARTRPLLCKLVNRGSIFAFSDGKAVMGQQLGDGGIYVSVWCVKLEDWMDSSGYHVRDPKAVKAALHHEFRDWAPAVKELITAFDESVIWPRSLIMLPVGMRWESKPGVTILGDAAHVMTPFVGEGVNGAMRDALELSESILGTWKRGWSKNLLAKNIRRYEEGMFTRIHKVQKMTEDMMKLMLFTEGAPRTVMDKWIVRSMSDELHVFLVTLSRLALSAYYFFFKMIY